MTKRGVSSSVSTTPAQGHERVMYPGRLEVEEHEKREAEGIPVHPEVLDWFQDLCGELAIPYRLGKLPEGNVETPESFRRGLVL